MSVADKLAVIAMNEQRVYEAGKQAELNAFWETFQEGGNRNSYLYAFRGAYWKDVFYNPKYPIVGDMQQVFIASGVTNTKVPIVVNGSIASGFQGASVKTIPSIDLTDCTSCNRTFYNAGALESVTFVGRIKINDLNVSYSPNLSKESLLSLLNCLEEKPESEKGDWIVTLGTTNKAKLSADELAIATGKNWEVK